MKKKYKKFFLIICVFQMFDISTVLAAQGAKWSGNGEATFIPNHSQTSPVDPTDPGASTKPQDPTNSNGPNEGTSGPLSIDFASSLNFGKNKISSRDVVYYAEPQIISDNISHTKIVPNYVQISDLRGNNSGWALRVKLKNQLRNETAEYKELDGAQLTISKGSAVSNQDDDVKKPIMTEAVLIPGVLSNLMYTSKGSGAGTWINSFGDLDRIKIEGKEVLKNTGVQLSIPGASPKSPVTYKSKLIWVLSDTPIN